MTQQERSIVEAGERRARLDASSEAGFGVIELLIAMT